MKILRIKKEIKQKTVAKFLNISEAAYSRKENNQRSFNIDEVVKIASFFNISIDELILKK